VTSLPIHPLLNGQPPALFRLYLHPVYYPVFAGLGTYKREIEQGFSGYTEGQLKTGAVEIIFIGKKN